VRAGAQVILEAIASQGGHTGELTTEMQAQVNTLVPGLGAPSALILPDGAPSLGKTLKELNIRALSGATVVAIHREGDGVIYPTADEALRSGDTLVLVGTAQSVDAARTIVLGPASARV